ncbi:MAG: hypothetical protein O6926_07725 [candidate division NC10 bacterium]|nr:hypothetical protein [candidate division NC10 bacterium]
MGRWLLSAMIAGMLCGCAVFTSQGFPIAVPEQYAHHRMEDDDLAIYWNIVRQDGQVVAEGYVEHVDDPGITIKWVDLTLQGLDAEGRVVSEATGVPHRDMFMVGDQGFFRIPMPVTGRERDFMVRARYWWEPFDASGGNVPS